MNNLQPNERIVDIVKSILVFGFSTLVGMHFINLVLNMAKTRSLFETNVLTFFGIISIGFILYQILTNFYHISIAYVFLLAGMLMNNPYLFWGSQVIFLLVIAMKFIRIALTLYWERRNARITEEEAAHLEIIQAKTQKKKRRRT